MTGNGENRGRNVLNVGVTDLQNSAQNGLRAFLLGVGRPNCGEQIASTALYCTSRVPVYHILGSQNRTFPSTTLRYKVVRTSSAISPVSSTDPPLTPAPRTSGAPSLWPHLAP